MKELWKDIEGYEGLYQASNLGRIKSFYRPNLVMKFKTDKDGYLHIGLTKDGKQKTFRAHRLIAIAFVSNPSNLPEVNHKNLRKNDNRAKNLEWTDERGNKKHYHKDRQLNTGIIPTGKTFKAQFTVKRKLYCIGYFKTYDLALSAYNEAFLQKDSPKELKSIILKYKQKFPRHVF